MKEEKWNEIWGVCFFLLGIFTLACLFFYHPEDLSFYTSHPNQPVQNFTGITGAYLAFGLRLAVGRAAYLISAIFLIWAWCFFKQNVPERKWPRLIGLVTAIASSSILLALMSSEEGRFFNAGALGYVTGGYLLKYFGLLGSFIITGAVLALSLLLATEFLLYPLAVELWNGFLYLLLKAGEWTSSLAQWIRGKFEKEEGIEEEDEEPVSPREKKKRFAKKQKITMSEEMSKIPLKVKAYRAPSEERQTEKKNPVEKSFVAPPAPKIKKENSVESTTPSGEVSLEGIIGASSDADSGYRLPECDLLEEPVALESSADNLQENSRIIEETLAEFGIEVKVVEVEQGPVITRYELLPAPGVKVNSIASLSDDLALALKAATVRLIIPIPGKSAVGIEVPNSVVNAVYLRELIKTPEFQNPKHQLPLALGKDVSGRPLIADLASMPHLLIAGTTGSGKTVCVNAIISGLLYRKKPSELKFVMIDPKMVEMAVYNKIPHMLNPVVTDVKKAANTLEWVVQEMERRYRLLATVGVRNITTFNSRVLTEEDKKQVDGKDSENVIPATLPYIVVVIDELADLMLVSQDKVEPLICRLAQLARAVGIHLLLATQRPSVDVITGVIKANFPARISFKVASKVDSRTVLDGVGADKLIGKGDMLFLKPGEAKPIRGQAPLVIDSEINRIVKHVNQQAKPEYHEELQEVILNKPSVSAQMEKDELYDDALRIVLETRQASTSNLQRRLRLGYTRAARIIDQLEAEGVIGPQQGAKPRAILLDQYPSEEQAFQQAEEAALDEEYEEGEEIESEGDDEPEEELEEEEEEVR